MLKRQDSLLSSSSSRRDHKPLPPEKPPAKSVGCFAGIIQFLSKYQIGRRRKFLTFGKKQSESTKLQPSPKSELFEVSPTVREKKLVHPTVNVGGARFNANELPTNKIRPLLNHPSNSSLSENKLPTTTFISSEETRRKLLDALDKCDNDLKEIMQIVRFHEEKSHTKILLQEEDYSSVTTMKHRMRFNISEQPYELNRSTFNNSNIYSKRHETPSMMAGGGTDEQRKKPGESYTDIRILKKVAKRLLEEAKCKQRRYSSFGSSKAMIQDVDEVCGDICWGEIRQVRRLGLELQEFICGELIQEFITDFSSSQIHSLPYQKCKRRIQF